MKDDDYLQLSNILGLSRQRDGIELTRALIGRIGAMVEGAHVSVMEIYGHRRSESEHVFDLRREVVIRRFDDSGWRPEEVQPLPDVTDVLHRLQPTAADCEVSKTGRLMIPVESDIGPTRMVAIDDVPMDPWVRARIMQLVEVYGNLITLMDSRERDSLTKLLNRHNFAKLFDLAKRIAKRDPALSLTLAVLDIDHFKRVNDNFGHLYGDEVLIHFARLMERSFRYTDMLFRFGGEEFVALLSPHRPGMAQAILERFRSAVQQYEFPGVGHITVSVGYVSCDGDVLPTTLVDRADRALYFAKAKGRNRVVDHADVDETVSEESGSIDLF
ncbi:MAG: GGDEF domain-containing protein [Gammaproteobacteria bacterium]|nr:GGDEF domain-containing protein [Gammaproteobacteria bacterium]